MRVREFFITKYILKISRMFPRKNLDAQRNRKIRFNLSCHCWKEVLLVFPHTKNKLRYLKIKEKKEAKEKEKDNLYSSRIKLRQRYSVTFSICYFD